MTDNIKIRSDLPSSAHSPPIKLQVSLPNPVASLVMEVLLLEKRQNTLKTEAGKKLLKEIELQLAKGPKNRGFKLLIDIERPYASEMKLLNPALTKKFHQCSIPNLIHAHNVCVHCFNSFALALYVHLS